MGNLTEKLGDYILKCASHDSGYSEKEKQMGMRRAYSRSHRAHDFPHKELFKKDTVGALRGAATYGTIGSAIGALAGALIGKKSRINPVLVGAILGGTGGASVGASYGSLKAREEWLKDRGISFKKKNLLMMGPSFDERATKKYLEPHRKNNKDV